MIHSPLVRPLGPPFYLGYRDFEIVKPISRGAFGSVYLARKKDTKQLYAMKIMRKTTLWRKNMVDQVRIACSGYSSFPGRLSTTNF